MPSEPRSSIDAWNSLVDLVDDADMDRIDAMSPEELDAALLAAGVSTHDPKVRDFGAAGTSPVAALPAPTSGHDVEHDAQVVDLAPVANDATVVPIGRKRNRFAVIRDVPLVYPAAAVVLAILAANYLHLFGDPHAADPKDVPTPPDPSAPHVTPEPIGPTPIDPGAHALTANEHRDLATAACAAGTWDTCGAELDAAAAREPDSEKLPNVREMRTEVKSAMAKGPKGP